MGAVQGPTLFQSVICVCEDKRGLVPQEVDLETGI